MKKAKIIPERKRPECHQAPIEAHITEESTRCICIEFPIALELGIGRESSIGLLSVWIITCYLPERLILYRSIFNYPCINVGTGNVSNTTMNNVGNVGAAPDTEEGDDESQRESH